MASGYPVVVNGVTIKTVEALYQACRFPDRPDVQEYILAEASPMVAKRKSMPYRQETRSDWELIRHNVMRWSLRVKLAQNYSKFSELLLNTGDRAIVEQSSKDDYWGAFPREGGTLVGQNVLGRLLMELRMKLVSDVNESLRVVHPLDISDFVLLGEPIEIIDSRGELPPPQNKLL